MSKPFQCDNCGKRFGSREARRQHIRDAHERNELNEIPKSVRAEIAAQVFEDMPDGAFFAAAYDVFGLEPEDFCK